MKSLITIGSARLIVIGCQIINIKLYTTHLSNNELGQYFYLIAISYALNALIFVPVDYYQQANSKKTKEKYKSLHPFLQLNKILITSIIIISIATSLFIYYLYNTTIIPEQIVWLTVLAITIYTTQALRNTINNQFHRNITTKSFIIESVTKIVVFYILIIITDTSALTLIYSWIIANSLTTIYLAVKANKLKLFSSKIQDKYVISIREIFCFSYPFSIAALCNWAQLQGYRLILVPLGYEEEVGIFATLTNIGSTAMNAAAMIYSQQFTPSLYQSEGKTAIHYLIGATILVSITTGAFLILGEQTISVITTSELSKFWKSTIAGILIDGINMLAACLIIYLTIKNKTKKLILPNTMSAFISILGILILVHQGIISPYSIGYPIIISQAFLFFVLLHISKLNYRTGR